MLQNSLMAFLLLATLAFASPTKPSSTKPYGPFSHLPQVENSTTTSLNLPSIPTLTLEILQPPFVSLHTLTARDAPTTPQTAPTSSLTSDLASTTSTTTTTTTKVPVVTLQTTTSSSVLRSDTENDSTVTLQATTSISALRGETETASTLTLQTITSNSVSENDTETASVAIDSGLAPTPTKWDCTNMCGALDEDGDCSVVSGCVAESEGVKVKGGKPPNQRSSAGSIRSSARYYAMAVLALMMLVVFWGLV